MPLSPGTWAAREVAATVVGATVATLTYVYVTNDPAGWLVSLAAGALGAFVAFVAAGPAFRYVRPRHDRVTGLTSSEAFLGACRRELARADHFKRRVALVLLEIDRLHDVTGVHGRRAGDAVLRETAHLLRRFTREYDVAARVSGGRFALLLPESDLIRAASTAERIRELAAARQVDVPGASQPFGIALSAGVAAWRGDGDDVQGLVERAELALADAKREGGGRTRTSLLVRPSRLGRGGAGSPGSVERATGRTEESSDTPASLGAERRRRLTVAYALGVGAVGLPLLAFSTPAALGADLPTLAFFLLLVAVTEVLLVDVFGRSTFSAATAPVLAAGLLLGAPAGAFAGGFVALVHALRRRPVWYKTVFNASSHSMAGLVSTLVFWRVTSSLDTHQLPLLVVAGLLSGGIHHLQTALISLGIALETRQNVGKVWLHYFGWQWPEDFVLGLLGMLLAVSYVQIGPLGAVVFLAPAIMLRFLAQQYVDRSMESVQKLRELNEQLRAEMARRALVEEEKTRLAHEAAEAAALRKLDHLKTELLNTVSHELRTPLTLIHGFAELLALDSRDFELEDLRRMGREIHRGSTTMLRIVEDLLDFGRIEGGRLRLQLAEADLAELVRSAVNGFRVEPGGDRLLVDVPSQPLMAVVDGARVCQIVGNFVSNALRYARSGVVHVSLARTTSGQAMIEVRDEGPGLSSEALSRVWDMFYRGPEMMESPIRGAGIGLAVVKNLVEAHGGRVEVESEPGRGAAFRAYLPLPSEPPIPIPRRARPADEASSGASRRNVHLRPVSLVRTRRTLT